MSIRRRRVRDGALLPLPRTHAELASFAERAFDAILERDDLVVISADGARTLAALAGLEIIDETNRRAWVFRNPPRPTTDPRSST
jgi:hypothetical protein